MKNENAAVAVKICGLKRPEHAALCAELGAAAVGCVFFPRSPRNVGVREAGEIVSAVAGAIPVVGVFVNAGYDEILAAVEESGIGAVQLHGCESPELVHRIGESGLTVIKTLFAARRPIFADAPDFRPTAFLVECGRGALPGGNAETWDWSSAGSVRGAYPLILAGGLDPENVGRAVEAAHPDAVDVSSGVESAPGVKDPVRIRAFMEAAAGCVPKRRTAFPPAEKPDLSGKKLFCP